jgi:NDP-4-keto-2,6-dideoxyhexose 3-C-methyltransferase
LDASHIQAIAEVNADKFGKVTPGSLIPIEDEKLILEKKPDYFLVLPWHFKAFFETNNAFKGIKLLFPLPFVEEIALNQQVAQN